MKFSESAFINGKVCCDLEVYEESYDGERLAAVTKLSVQEMTTFAEYINNLSKSIIEADIEAGDNRA